MGSSALLSLILPAILPAVTDGLRGLAQKFFGGTKPVSVDDQIKLMEAETSKLQALAALDAPAANISQWVADLRASFRYILAGLVILGTVGLVILYFSFSYISPENAETLRTNLEPILDAFIQMAGSVFSFIFGERMYLNLKRTKS